MARHEALRTTFRAAEGAPLQVIDPIAAVDFQVIRLGHLGFAEQARRIEELRVQAAQKPFDLEHGPLLRAKLLRVSRSDHLLLLTIHHIVADIWSLGIVMRETALLYEAQLAGREAGLDAPRLQYADFAVWQRQWLRGEVLARHIDYWRGALEGRLLISRSPPTVFRPLSGHGAATNICSSCLSASPRRSKR